MFDKLIYIYLRSKLCELYILKAYIKVILLQKICILWSFKGFLLDICSTMCESQFHNILLLSFKMF